MLDVHEFRRAGYQAARRTNGALVEFRMATGPTPSFHQAVIAYRDQTVAVAATRTSALLAIISPRAIDPTGPIDASPLTFLDHPTLAAALAPFRVLAKAELNAPFDAEAWPSIPPGDLAYWRPTTVGEARFNYWD